jgi:amino acid transporter
MLQLSRRFGLMNMDSVHAATEPRSTAEIGLIGAMAIGIGGMVGGGIFAVLGEAVSLAHGATAMAFLAAGLVAFLTCYSYAKLSVRYPSQGGTVVFIDRAFGTDLVTGAINLILWLSYLVTLALYAVAFGSYGLTFFPDHGPWLRHVIISAGILSPVAINLLNAAIVSKTESIVVVIKLVLLFVVIVAGVGYVDAARISADTWGSPISIIGAGMVIFVAYEGFELIANSAQEIRNPTHTLPRAYFATVIFVIVLYVLIALVTVGTVSEGEIAKAKDYALAVAAKPGLGAAGFTMVAISALLATFSAINATIYGNARLGYILAKDGELPKPLGKKAWNEPVSGVIIVGALSLLMANSIDLTAIAIISSAGFLLIFAVTNAAAVRLAKETGGNRWISLLATLVSLAALITLLFHTYEDSPHALWVFVGFIIFSFLFELTYGKLVRAPLKLPHRPGRYPH